MNLDEKKLDEIKQRSALAHKYICELAAGKHRWNMCIPPQPDDSDMALQAPIDDIKFLLEKIKRLEKAVELMRESLEISALGITQFDGVDAMHSARKTLAQVDEILKGTE